MRNLYTLTGNKGTRILVTVEYNQHNCATDAVVDILSIASSSPDYYVDALTIEQDFLIGHCFDGNAQTGSSLWLVLTEQGELNHFDCGEPVQYAEIFNIVLWECDQ